MTKKYALDLDDVHAGWVAAPDGYFDVVPWLRERRGALLVEPAGAFWAWLDDGLGREAAIVAFDEEGQEVERLVVEDAWSSELGLPRLDAGRGGAMWLQLEGRTAEMRAGGQTTASAREAGVTIAGCQLHLHGSEAPPLPVEAIGALSFALERRSSLQRLAMTVTGAPLPGSAEAEARVGGEGALEYLDSARRTVARVEFRVAGLDVQMAAAEAGGAPRARLALACRGLRLGARRESGSAGDASA